MASNNDYDSDLAGDTLTATKAKQRQTSFDQTNLPAQYQPPAAAPVAPAPVTTAAPGPIGRVAQQLPANPAQPAMSLESARPTSIGDGRSAIYASVGANGEASFSNTPSTLNSLSSNFAAPDQAPDQRLSSLPGLAQAGSIAQQPPKQFPTSLAELIPGGPSPVTAAQPQRSQALTDALPGYTATPAPLSPAAQQQASLGDAWRGGSSTGPGFAALGSAANMGDGVGTFSQANQGDAALAMGRFQKAADLRDGFKAKDHLQEAQAAQTRDRNFTVVRNSETPLTRRELKFDQDRANTTQSLADAVTGAQGAINSQRQGVAADQQQRQANRLEDIMNAGTSPNATPDQQAAARRALDPTGSKEADLQLTQAKIEETNASAAKLRNGSKAGNLPVGLQKLEDGDIDAVSNVQSINTQMGTILSQLDNGSLVLGPIENRKNAALNAAGRSNPQSVNYASFMSSLEKIRNDSLRLNKGPQTEGDANRAWNELLANVNDPSVVKQRLGEIQAMNNKASQVRLGMINSRRKNQGIGPLNVDDILGNTPQSAPNQGSQPQQAQGPATTAPKQDHSALWGG